MSRVGRTLKGYLFWTHDRGSFHYDVMVTLILVFIFVAPRFIDFKDQPPEKLRHQNQVIVSPDGRYYQADADSVDAQDEAMVRANFQRLIRPIAGPVVIESIEPLRDSRGRIIAYRAHVRR